MPLSQVVPFAFGVLCLNCSAVPSGGFSILAQGLLPGSCHTAYRAEIMAVCSAVPSFLRPIVTMDCKGVVDDGNRILDELRRG